jgi:hypothetical protein
MFLWTVITPSTTPRTAPSQPPTMRDAAPMAAAPAPSTGRGRP